jgi:hypothetical protein
VRLTRSVAAASGSTVVILKGDYTLSGELTISQPMTIQRTSHRFGSRLFFTGTGPRSIQTTVKHLSEGVDAPISAAFRIESANVRVLDLYICCQYTGTETATQFGADWDVGILVKSKSFFYGERLRLDGYWRSAGIRYDVTAAGGNCDGSTLTDVWSKGFWGLLIQGAEAQVGQPMDSGDLRGAGGMSDFTATNCRFFGMDHTSAVRYLDTDGGAALLDGLVGPNSLGRVQGHRFVGCRFATREPYVLRPKNTARDLLIGCHIERLSGFRVDGVTAITKSMVSVDITASARFPRLIGTDIHSCGTSSIAAHTELERLACHEEGVAVPNILMSVAKSGAFRTVAATPTLTGSTGALSGGTPYSVQVGDYTRNGNTITYNARIALADVTGLAGNLSIALPLPSTSAQEVVVPVMTALVNHSADGKSIMGLISAGSSAITLYRVRDNASVSNLSASAVVAGSTFWLTVTYPV